jgi:3-oxoadipate enol-lactonase/3-oxoadipate enol-lactonase/4-carboxymuconolactone decarboxylase
MTALAHSLINDADPSAPLLILGPSLGTHGSQWAGVAYRLADDFRVVTLDLPGHGASTFFFAGVSISGAVALTLALRHPQRLRGVAALCTGAYFGGAERWNERIGEVRAAGSLRALVPDTADRWFAAGFLDEDIAAGPIVLEQLAQTDPEGYIDCCGALAAYDIRDRVATIDVPLLLLAGAQDPGNTPDSMRELHQQVEGSSFAVIPDAAHLPMVEHPELVAERLERFFTQQLD